MTDEALAIAIEVRVELFERERILSITKIKH